MNEQNENEIRKKPLFVPLTQKDYDALVVSLREHRGNLSKASREVGVTRKTAAKAWRYGWPKRGWPPIEQVIKEEERLARASRFQAAISAKGEDAKTAALENKCDGTIAAMSTGTNKLQLPGVAEEMDRLRARQDAIEARTQEAQLVKLSRGNTIALLASTSHLLKSAMDKARTLDENIRDGTVKFTPQQTMSHIKGCAWLAKTAAEAGKMSLEMERLLLGAPTSIVGIQAGNMTLNDAEQVIGMAQRAMERVRANVVAEAVVVEPVASRAHVDGRESRARAHSQSSPAELPAAIPALDLQARQVQPQPVHTPQPNVQPQPVHTPQPASPPPTKRQAVALFPSAQQPPPDKLH